MATRTVLDVFRDISKHLRPIVRPGNTCDFRDSQVLCGGMKSVHYAGALVGGHTLLPLFVGRGVGKLKIVKEMAVEYVFYSVVRKRVRCVLDLLPQSVVLLAWYLRDRSFAGTTRRRLVECAFSVHVEGVLL